jgi:8-hydroxy-5-deazaflavin:NADPH oxidoreductase
VIDVTNAFMLPAEIQESELHGRLSSEVNAESVPGAKLVKAFNQLPMRALIAPLPDSTGRRVVFVASDYEDASAEVSHLAEQLGFAPVQVGKIAEGGRLIQARAALFIPDVTSIQQPGCSESSVVTADQHSTTRRLPSSQEYQ